MATLQSLRYGFLFDGCQVAGNEAGPVLLVSEDMLEKVAIVAVGTIQERACMQDEFQRESMRGVRTLAGARPWSHSLCLQCVFMAWSRFKLDGRRLEVGWRGSFDRRLDAQASSMGLAF